jgi:putative transposase
MRQMGLVAIYPAPKLSQGDDNHRRYPYLLRNLAALEAAFDWGVPEIFNSDQGSQFTGNEFTSRWQRQGIQISQDGRGRVFDNIFVERLWRSVKYEEVYLKDYESLVIATDSLSHYFQFYNYERFHQALTYRTPAQVHFSGQGGDVS